MSDPNNPSGWQDVSNPTGATPPSSATPPPGYPPPSQAYTQPPPPSAYAQAPGMSANTAAAVSYITFIPAVIFLIIEPYKRIPFVRFHSIQSIALFVVWTAIKILLSFALLPMLLTGTHFIYWGLSSLISLFFFIIWIYTMVQAAQGKWFKLPVIGDFALKQAQSL